MEAFKYYIDIDIKNLAQQKLDKNYHENYNNKNYDENWSLFNTIEKKIVIKRNVGKLIGYSGETISKLRNDNKNIFIKIDNQKNTTTCREVFIRGANENINNFITQIKTIIGEENIVY